MWPLRILCRWLGQGSQSQIASLIPPGSVSSTPRKRYIGFGIYPQSWLKRCTVHPVSSSEHREVNTDRELSPRWLWRLPVSGRNISSMISQMDAPGAHDRPPQVGALNRPPFICRYAADRIVSSPAHRTPTHSPYPLSLPEGVTPRRRQAFKP